MVKITEQAIFAVPMRYFARFAGILFTLYAFVVFTVFLLLILPFVIIASFFGKINGGNFIYLLCKAWSRFFVTMTGIFHRTSYGEPGMPGQPYVYVFNHISFLDIPVMLLSIKGCRFRVLGKAEMGRIPLFGFIYRSAAVLVERDNAANRAKSVLQLKAVLRKKISIVIFPEGTFNMTQQPLKDFYDGAFRIAIETQTPIRPVLLPDTYDRMNYRSIFSLQPGRSRAVYLDAVPTQGLTIKDLPALKATVYKMMEDGLVKLDAGWIKG